MFRHIVCLGAGKGLKIENRMGSRLRAKPARWEYVLKSELCTHLERKIVGCINSAVRIHSWAFKTLKIVFITDN